MKELSGKLSDLGLPEDVRAEQITPEKFLELYNAIIVKDQA